MLGQSNIVQEKAEVFAVRIVKCAHYIRYEKREYALADQLLRCGTSIGANICESEFAQSTADFISKLSISLKEAAETRFWLRLLSMTEYLDERQFKSLYKDISELVNLLAKIIKTTKERKEEGIL